MFGPRVFTMVLRSREPHNTFNQQQRTAAHIRATLGERRAYLSNTINPFRTAVPFWGQTSHISSSLSPKRDSGPKGVNREVHSTFK